MPRAGVGRPRRRPHAVIADKASSSQAIRQTLRRRGIRAMIPKRADQKANRMRRGRGPAAAPPPPPPGRRKPAHPGEPAWYRAAKGPGDAPPEAP
ncbi:hypothetical protein ACFQ6C_21670, partial [Streptomyces sp. NPDC056454]